MNNPQIVVEVDGKDTTVELLLLASSRRLSDECFLQARLGFERYRDWTVNGEGWTAPDAQDALIRTSLNRAGVNFSEMDVEADAIIEAIVEALKQAVDLEDDELDPTSGKSSG